MVRNDKSRMYSGSFRNGKMVYGRLAPGEENSGKLVNMVREKAKEVAKINNLDTTILDGPPGIGCPVISTITGVDKVVIVTEPTISGLHDLQRTIEIVKKFSRRGPFYACSNYPKCTNAYSGEPTGETCEECGGLIIKNKTGKSKCSNKDCKK